MNKIGGKWVRAAEGGQRDKQSEPQLRQTKAPTGKPSTSGADSHSSTDAVSDNETVVSHRRSGSGTNDGTPGTPVKTIAACDTDRREALSLFMYTFCASNEAQLPCWLQSSNDIPASAAAEAAPQRQDEVPNCFRNSPGNIPITPPQHGAK